MPESCAASNAARTFIQHIAGVLLSRAIGTPMIRVLAGARGWFCRTWRAGESRCSSPLPPPPSAWCRRGGAGDGVGHRQLGAHLRPARGTDGRGGQPADFGGGTLCSPSSRRRDAAEIVGRINARCARPGATGPPSPGGKRRMILRLLTVAGRGGEAGGRGAGPHHPRERHHARMVSPSVSTGSPCRWARGRHPARSPARAPLLAIRGRGRAARRSRPRACRG